RLPALSRRWCCRPRRERTDRRHAVRSASPGVAAMTAHDRIDAIAAFGFTPRQARFLVTVALHGGYCLRRQYLAFAGLRYGKNVRDFLDGLVSQQLAQRFVYQANRGHLYHLHAKSLYRALEQRDNRNRRQVSPAAI